MYEQYHNPFLSVVSTVSKEGDILKSILQLQNVAISCFFLQPYYSSNISLIFFKNNSQNENQPTKQNPLSRLLSSPPLKHNLSLARAEKKW